MGNSLRYFLTALVLATGFTLDTAAAAEDPSPNVLFIAVDDLNDWVGCLDGHPQTQTPNIDRLAASGTLFSNAHCQAPICNPSRTSVMTGLRPSVTGIYGLNPWFRNVPALADRITLAQNFRAAGYLTLTTGKIFHGNYPGGNPQKRKAEFDIWGPNASWKATPESKIADAPSKNILVDWGTFPHGDKDRGDYAIASWAVEKLGSMPDDKPFFMGVGFFLPHLPCYAPPAWFEKFPLESLVLPPVLEGDRDDLPKFASYLHWSLPEPRLPWLKKADQWKPLVQSYLASVAFMDAQVGRVLDALEKSPFASNTIIVLWSDHGWHLGEKDITGKNTLWERSTRVPLIFAGPGITPGAVTHRPAELLDLYPTLNELCSLPHVEGLQGISLTPQLKNPDAPRERPAITTHNQDNHSVRTEKWRYIHYADGTDELYNTDDDPNEWRNLAADPGYAETVASLAEWLPKKSLWPVAGSAQRILTYKDGVATWEGKVIDQDAPLPPSK